MRKKYKITGFTRLLIFLIFFTPIAYVGASYYNGEDGIQNIKSFLKINESNNQKIEQKQSEIKKHEAAIKELKADIRKLENPISKKD